MADNDYDLKIGANSDAAKAEFNKIGNEAEKSAQKIQQVMREASYNMASAMKESASKMHSAFDGVTGTIEKMKGAMLAFTAIVAGGAAFKEMVAVSLETTKSAMALGKSLGITATQASILNVALDDVYLSQDTMNAANQRLVKTLDANPAAFKKLGVATRDSSGHLRSSLDIMLDTNTALLKFKEGIDRNTEGQRIYGRSWAEVSGILKLTKEGMDKSAEKARELGLIVGQENVAATDKYKEAMNDVGDVLKATQKAIGDALMPVLTKLGEWFSSIGPAVVTIFKGAIGGLVAVFWGLKLGVEVVFESILAGIEVLGAGIKFLVNGMVATLSGDWSGAKKAWDKGGADLADIAQRHLDRVAGSAQEAQDQIYNLFATPTATAPAPNGINSNDKDEPAKKTVSRTGDWKAELTQQLEESKSYFKDSLQIELDFWNTKLTLTKKSSKERASVEHELFVLHKRQAQETLQAEVADLKAQAAAAQAGGTERVRIAGEVAGKIGEKYGMESKEFKAAMADVVKAAQENEKQLLKIEELRLESVKEHALGEIDIAREKTKIKKDLGEISNAQELQALKRLEQAEYEIELKAAQDKAELVSDPEQRQAELNRIEAITRKHGLNIIKINGDIAKDQKAQWDKAFAPIGSAFEKSINGIIAGTTTLKKALSSLFKSILLELANVGVQMVVKWVSNEAFKTAATVSGVATRTAAETAGAAASSTIGGAAAIKNIMNSAYEAMAGAYKAIVSIPVIGPYLAPVVAAGAFTAVSGLVGSIASAEGGYDIPAGINPMTQLHEKEMVLPKAQAEAVRNMADGGSNGGGTVHIHTNGGDFVHKKDLAKLLKGMNRNFVFIK